VFAPRDPFIHWGNRPTDLFRLVAVAYATIALFDSCHCVKFLGNVCPFCYLGSEQVFYAWDPSLAIDHERLTISS